MADALLQVEECSYTYGEGAFRLHEVSLDVRPGEMLGIVGPNGSGKSTLLRLMAALLRPEHGRVLLRGEPIAAMARRALARRVAFLPQAPETSFRFRTHEVVAMGRYAYVGGFGFLGPGDVAAVERALAATETAHLAERDFSTLSGGEKQRALIAAVLCQEPQVMLLDEPTAALDLHHAAHVFGLLRGFADEGISVVLVTHDLNGAAEYCDRLALLAGGRLRECADAGRVMREDLLTDVYGTPVTVFANPVSGSPMAALPRGRGA
jgi:iron complex transport system ATP-binding protein